MSMVAHKFVVGTEKMGAQASFDTIEDALGFARTLTSNTLEDGVDQISVTQNGFPVSSDLIIGSLTDILTGSQPPAILDTAAQAVEDSQMTTQAPKVEQSVTQLAAEDIECVDIIDKFIKKVAHDEKYTNELVFAINNYLIADGFDGNKSHDELALLATRAKVNGGGRVTGIFKLTGQIKNSPAFKALEAKYQPTLQVVGGNERGTIVAVAAQMLQGVTDVPQDILDAHCEPANVSHKPAKAAKGSKKKTKKEKTLLPLPTIADLATLEAMDRKSLMSAMSATNQHKVTGVKGNGKTSDILTALAKHILGVDYVPTEKSKAPKSGKGSKVEQLLDLPTDLQWSEVKNMKFRELQQLAKAYRSHGLYEGNLAGKGVTKEHLLSSVKQILRSQGQEIIEANISKQDPDNATPTLEKVGMKYDLLCKGTELLIAHAA